MDSQNYVNGEGIPIGFGMALAQTRRAFDSFATMPRATQESIIEGTHQIHSKQEMKQYVSSILQGR